MMTQEVNQRRNKYLMERAKQAMQTENSIRMKQSAFHVFFLLLCLVYISVLMYSIFLDIARLKLHYVLYCCTIAAFGNHSAEGNICLEEEWMFRDKSLLFLLLCLYLMKSRLLT